MADFKTTNFYGDIYVNNKVGINTNVPATRLQIGQLSPTAATEGLQFGDDTGARLYRGGANYIQASSGLQVGAWFYATTYIQTGGNLIYPSSYSATQRLEVGNSANNNWIDGMTIAPGGNVTVTNNLVVNGNIGIGTSSPGSLLELSSSTATSLFNIKGASGNGVLFVSSSGNVGIGVSAPSNFVTIGQNGILSVIPPANSAAVLIKGKSGSGTAMIEVQDATPDVITTKVTMSASGSQGYIGTFSTHSLSIVSGGSEKVRVNGFGGNVGIGTTSPAAKLHVSGSMMLGDVGTFRPRQTIVGEVTPSASATYKKIFVCGSTSTGTINVIAIITNASTAAATATFSYAVSNGTAVAPNRLSYVSLNSTITSVDCQYNNTGTQMEISVTYTGATAPTIYFTAEGLGSQTWTY